jgi:UDP-N-acetylmuramyl pentapeptide phosphotransferase/UDP-N-acetylglucosamine-1-phosphate transferase
MAAGIADAPDSRKMHLRVTPTGGGLAIAAGFALALTAAFLAPGMHWRDDLGFEMIGRMSLAAALSFFCLTLGIADDIRPLDAKVKFGLIGGVSLIGAVMMAHAQVLPIFGDIVIDLGFVGGVLGSALWMFTIINATNFIDGANGLCMGQMSIGLLGLAAVSQDAGAPDAAMLALAGAGAAAGFLFWNFPGGKIFAGDAGALFIGAVTGCAGLLAIADGGVSPFLLPILFFPALADVLLTLAWRLKRGRSLLVAHRDHLFQIGLRSKLGHARVSLIYWLLTAVCGIIAILVETAQRTGTGPLADLLSGTPFFAWIGLAALSVAISVKVRAYARANRLDEP